MGLYDDIQYRGRTFQTKDFDCCLRTYKIIIGSRLILLPCQAGGPVETVFHTGVVEFYKFHDDLKWMETYFADFNSGMLKSICGGMPVDEFAKRVGGRVVERSMFTLGNKKFIAKIVTPKQVQNPWKSLIDHINLEVQESDKKVVPYIFDVSVHEDDGVIYSLVPRELTKFTPVYR